MRRMDLKTYICDTQRRHALAASLGTSPDYLWQMATGWRDRRPSPEMAVAIHRATNGEVRCDDMRDDLTWTFHPDGAISYSVTVAAKDAA